MAESGTVSGTVHGSSQGATMSITSCGSLHHLDSHIFYVFMVCVWGNCCFLGQPFLFALHMVSFGWSSFFGHYSGWKNLSKTSNPYNISFSFPIVDLQVSIHIVQAIAYSGSPVNRQKAVSWLKSGSKAHRTWEKKGIPQRKKHLRICFCERTLRKFRLSHFFNAEFLAMRVTWSLAPWKMEVSCTCVLQWRQRFWGLILDENPLQLRHAGRKKKWSSCLSFPLGITSPEALPKLWFQRVPKDSFRSGQYLGRRFLLTTTEEHGFLLCTASGLYPNALVSHFALTL